ncbi:DoxX family membrane protein [Microbacterium sp. KUDC0406]|uniref:DoxX family membrane protein n=1 Tax=Microbacterium sp. KUDC0406 TaxID=2909588 RepID=UPI001F488C2A|nr:DoxX family membrane protein [Microbacterium sp. KUDC0406]UJP09853.1 DoxX family membrane protein [Microbacterium sp. KUDC0406]
MTPSAALAGPLIGGAARVAVGMLWLLEGIEKYRAGFGASDILLVADGAARNPRTPWWFGPLDAGMQALPVLFGFAIPALEVLLGVVLIAGLFTRLAALTSIATLMLYWGSDQLVDQYPVMVLLSAVVLAVPAAGRYGVGMLIDPWRATGAHARPRPRHPRRVSS